MKRYLFLKLGLTILVYYAAASPKTQVSDKLTKNGDERSRRNINQNGQQTAPPAQRGDTTNKLQDYQGVMGQPGVDFPVLTYIPRTKFTCRGIKSGYYADLETNCQVFHICDEGRKVSFLCPNGTIFQQSDLICDWWFKVDCASSPDLYDESAEQLSEDNRRRKENRRVQQQERRTVSKINNQNEANRQGREFPKQRRPNNQKENQSNFAKKDVNSYTSNQPNNYEIASQKPRDESTNNYKETQVPSETASFVNNRYSNNEQQKHYIKSYNDITANTASYLPPKSFSNSEFGAVKTVTERINRGSRNYKSSFSTDKSYRNQVSDFVKTTTQHTIYSPTVPPFTSRRFTTKTPTTLPISPSTESLKSRSFQTDKSNALSGFYITKELVPTTTISTPVTSEPIYVTQSTELPLVLNSRNAYSNPTTISPDYIQTTIQSRQNEQNTESETLHTTPASVDPTFRPLVGSGLITGSSNFGSFTGPDVTSNTFTSTVAPNQETTTFSYTTTKTENSEQTTVVSRNPKQIIFTTISPFGETILNTVLPSVPTPFRIQTESPLVETQQQTTIDDTQTTIRFSQNTYLPKSSVKNMPTPRPTIPTEYTSYTTPGVTENLSNMIKTLQDLEGKNPLIEVENLGTRPGLDIPPSAGPKTLHSLAIYFATALDNLVSNDTNEEYSGQETTTTSTTDDQQVTLLSRTTINKYNSLFSENNDENQVDIANSTDLHVRSSHDSDNIDLKSLVEHDAQYNDLDGQQSRGPVSSTPRIRQLAQVFTQALSAYLDDPGTFKKVLEEIRPTEPPLTDETDSTLVTTSSTTTTNEYPSYTKEEDEVLDFSDVDKSSSTHRPFNDISNSISSTPSALFVRSTTETFLNEISTHASRQINVSVPEPFTKPLPTPNPLALDLNNGLNLSTSSALQDAFTNDDESDAEENTESNDYLPFNTGEDEEEAKRRATYKPYGFDVKPENSTPISISQISPTAENWSVVKINSNESYTPPFDDLLPPFKVSLNHKIDDVNNSFTANEEYLQSAHSQSFISHTNLAGSDRDGKSVKILTDDTTESVSTTDFSKIETSTLFTSIPITDYTSTFVPSTTTNYESESTTQLYSNRLSSDEITTENSVTSTTNNPTTEQTTHFSKEYTTLTDTTTGTPANTKGVPDNHWSTSPEVAKLWETTLYVNPLIINQNLSDERRETTESGSYTVTTYRPEFTTKTIDDKTTTEYIDESVIDLKFTSTTEESTTVFSTPSPTTNFPHTTVVIDLGIHDLLNSTELEIASSQANQIFGNLDTREQDLLIEKMKEAESNSTVRRLILLLVSTCDASLSNNKTVQETRNSILHALLNVPLNKTDEPVEVSNRSARLLHSTNIHTELTTIASETTSYPDEISGKSSAILSKIETPPQTLDVKDVHQDTRALELLRSLYSLAAKWGKK